MLCSPRVVFGKFYFVNRPIFFPPNWNRKPHITIARLQNIPIPPVILGVLHVIVKDENICPINHLEIALPREVI
jgi:hypothetical protein